MSPSGPLEAEKEYTVPSHDPSEYYTSGKLPVRGGGMIFALASTSPLRTLEQADFQLKRDRCQLFRNSVKVLNELAEELRTRSDWGYVTIDQVTSPVGIIFQHR